MRLWMAWVWLGLLAAPVAAEAGLLFNEILADPASDWNGDGQLHSRDDEWIEIVNLTGDPIDLTGVRIASADTSWRYEFSGVLAPGDVRIAYGSDAYAWEVETGNPAFGLRLTNSGATITLWTLTEADTVLIDQLTYLDEEAEDDRSAGRPSDAPEEWMLFDGLNPYGGEPPPYATGCGPTPGVTNLCTLPVVERSWSAIKEVYTGTGEP